MNDVESQEMEFQFFGEDVEQMTDPKAFHVLFFSSVGGARRF
jgi:hypothetical protein